MLAALRGFAVLAMVIFVGSCQSEDPIVGTSEGDPGCALELEVIGTAVSQTAVLLHLIRGADWTDAAIVEWNAIGPGEATFSTNAESWPEVVFDRAGSWTVSATVTQSSGCGVGAATTTVSVAGRTSDCGVALDRTSPAYLNEPVRLALSLGPSRDPSESARWSVTGNGDAVITVIDSTGALRTAEVVFSTVGSHRVEVELTESARCSAVAADLAIEVGSSDPDCISVLTGPSEVGRHEAREFYMLLGSGWSASTEVEWSVGDRARVVATNDASSFQRSVDVVFDRPGLHTVRAVVRDEVADCGGFEHTKSVLVAQGDCGVSLRSWARVHVDAQVALAASLDADWAFEATGSRVQATWTIVEGPAGGIEIIYEQDGSTDSWRTLRFLQAGTYVLDVEIEDADFGDGYACPTWSERFEILVVGPPATPVPLGEVALVAPASGRVSKVSGTWPSAAFGTYGAVLVATERGTDAVDLLTGQPLVDVRRLSGAAIADPPRSSMAIGPSAGPFPLRLYETGVIAIESYYWRDDGWNPWSSSPLSGLEAVIDLVAPPAEPWIDPPMRQPLPPNPCSEKSVGLVSTRDGRVHEMRFRTCGSYDAQEFRILRFDVASTADPDAPLIGAALLSTGDVIAVTGGDTPRAFLASGATSSIVVQDLGPVGEDPRMIRAYGPIAVVASHGSDRIDVILAGALVASSPVGVGPTSVDLRHRDGGGTFALTTSGVDGSVTITEIDAAGQVVSTVTRSLPAGWSGELSGAWVHDPDFTYVIGGVGRSVLHVARR